jgi:hypothetical protein
MLTFILAYVLEGKREPGVFSLDDADFAKGTLSDDAQQAEVIEVHWGSLSVFPWRASLQYLHWQGPYLGR